MLVVAAALLAGAGNAKTVVSTISQPCLIKSICWHALVPKLVTCHQLFAENNHIVGTIARLDQYRGYKLIVDGDCTVRVWEVSCTGQRQKGGIPPRWLAIG